MKLFNLSPITKKRLQRFRQSKIAFYSLCVLVGIYFISLCAPLIANSKPLFMKFNGEYYFPFLHSTTPQEILDAAGQRIRVNYRDFVESPAFKQNDDNYAIFAPVRYSPDETVDRKDIENSRKVTVSYVADQPLARFNVISEEGEWRIIRPDNCKQFFPTLTEVYADVFTVKGLQKDEICCIDDLLILDNNTRTALEKHLAKGSKEVAYTATVKLKQPVDNITHLVLSLPATDGSVRKSLRVNVRIPGDEKSLYRGPSLLTFEKDGDEINLVKAQTPDGQDPSPDQIAHAQKLAKENYSNPRKNANQVQEWVNSKNQTTYDVRISDDANFPFHPTWAHPFGLDASGRDVFARILFATRIGLTFGLVLALTATILGIIIGAIQGYFGGAVDIVIQRFTEIWAALPFLYIMALLGNLLGRSFGLLLLVYGCFCWIGLSYYMRAEFLRLRNRPFVAAARCMGLSNTRIIFNHILPNALTPVITLFPFLLVGAIGTLVSLDFLGFGLPPLTPSWGELLGQAQEHRSAWWLIFFPTAAIFIVMFSTVMVGEGVRNAFDPKPFSKLQ